MEGLVQALGTGLVVFLGLASAAALAAFMYMVAKLYRRVGPNEALIIFGKGGTRIVTGGGATVWPLFWEARVLSLELMSFDVTPSQNFYTVQGVAVDVEAVAQIKVRSDHESIRTAAEQFLNKNPSEREGLIRLVAEGHLRGIIGQLTIESIVKEPEMVGEKVRGTCAEDLSKMGLELVSFTLKEVRDENDYITNMGVPDVARIKRDADVAAAEAERDTAIKRAIYMREAAEAKAQADMQRVQAETASASKQAESIRDLEVKKAEYTAVVATQKAQADKAYDIQSNVMQQQVVAEQVKIERVQREEQIKVQDAEILRRERELTATVLKPAEIERLKIEQLAEAEKGKISMEGAGRAEAVRVEAQGQAHAVRSIGLAEAESIRAKGAAEAEVMRMKADAYNGYNQAAVIDKLITNMPEIVRAISEPLRNVDRITVVSTGDGNSTGIDRLSGDIARMVAQVPPLVESLSGVNLQDLVSKLPQLGPTINRDRNGTVETETELLTENSY